mgnify:CR=1 FL=1|jgi:hypothetical protein
MGDINNPEELEEKTMETILQIAKYEFDKLPKKKKSKRRRKKRGYNIKF